MSLSCLTPWGHEDVEELLAHTETKTFVIKIHETLAESPHWKFPSKSSPNTDPLGTSCQSSSVSRLDQGPQEGEGLGALINPEGISPRASSPSLIPVSSPGLLPLLELAGVSTGMVSSVPETPVHTVPSCACWPGLIVNITAFTPHSALVWVTRSLWRDGCFYGSTCLGRGRPSLDAGRRIFPVCLREAFRRREYLHQRLSKEVPSPVWVRITQPPDAWIEHGNEGRNALSLSCMSGSCPRASALLVLGLLDWYCVPPSLKPLHWIKPRPCVPQASVWN